MARFLSLFLMPGVLLMRRLRVSLKLGAMVALLLAPLILMAIAQYRTLSEEIRIARAEQQGTHQVKTLTDLMGALQDVRDAWLVPGSGASDPGSAATWQQVHNALQAADRFESLPRLYGPIPGWEVTREVITAQAVPGRVVTAGEALPRLNGSIEALRVVIVRVAEESGLLLDPQALTYQLMDLSAQRLVSFVEALHRVRYAALQPEAASDAPTVKSVRLMGAREDMARQRLDLRLNMEAARRAGGAELASWRAFDRSLDAFDSLLNTGSDAVAGSHDTSRIAEAAISAVQAARTLHQELLSVLESALDARAVAVSQRLWWQMGAAGVAVAFVAWLALAFYLSFQGALNRLHKGVDIVATGDLSHQLTIFGRDEMAEIGSFVERMCMRLSAMVAEIRSSAVRVGMSGSKIASDSAALSQRSIEQAETLRMTLETARSLGVAVAANAEAATELDRLTERLRGDAEVGGRAMVETVESMSRLQTSSRRVGEIVSVIDGIAFQTNILALNAAVEAARAGEQGRGFAVVATEVRTLAQRSAAAAREIKALIAESTGQVDASVGRINHVGSVLESLVSGVRVTSERLRELAAASVRQRDELDEVARRVGDLDEITRANVALVEHSTLASQELVERAEALTGAVSTIRLRQGSADEATALVERGVALVRAHGLNGASATLHSAAEGFVDRDLYVFVIDREGRYVIHGARPDMEGKRVHDVPGIDGDRFLRDAWAAAAAGSGWIDYDIVHPKTGAVLPKTSYIVGVEGGLLMGCGIYRQVNATATAA